MYKGKKIIAIIPARGGSKRLPRKNVLPLDGKPLIAYSIEIAKKCRCIDRIIVSTDNEEIRKISIKYGAEVPLKRPRELSGDNVLVTPVVKHLISWLKDNEGFAPDIIILLQAVSPFVKVSNIENALKKLLSTDSDAVYTITPVDYPLFWMQKLNGDTPALLFEESIVSKIRRSQDMPKVYRPTGAVYAVKTESLMKRKNETTGMFLPKKNEKTKAIVVDKISSTDIDNELDYLFAQYTKKKITPYGMK